MSSARSISALDLPIQRLVLVVRFGPPRWPSDPRSNDPALVLSWPSVSDRTLAASSPSSVLALRQRHGQRARGRDRARAAPCPVQPVTTALCAFNACPSPPSQVVVHLLPSPSLLSGRPEHPRLLCRCSPLSRLLKHPALLLWLPFFTP